MGTRAFSIAGPPDVTTSRFGTIGHLAGLQKKNLDKPDERVQFDGLEADIVQVGEASISRNVFQLALTAPLGGRRPSGKHRAKESCQAHHSGVVVQGRLRIEMDDGSAMDLEPNEVFDIPPGHDGWVVSEEPWVGINWSGVHLASIRSSRATGAPLLFTDIVSSTETAVPIGGQSLGDLLGGTIRRSEISSIGFSGAQGRSRLETGSWQSSTGGQGHPCGPGRRVGAGDSVWRSDPGSTRERSRWWVTMSGESRCTKRPDRSGGFTGRDPRLFDDTRPGRRRRVHLRGGTGRELKGFRARILHTVV